MAKKPRAAKSNKLGLKNKAKTAARRAAKAKARPSVKAANKKKDAGKAKRAAATKAARAAPKAKAQGAGRAVNEALRPVAPEQTQKDSGGGAVTKEILVSPVTASPGARDGSLDAPKAPAENFLQSKAKALREQNARYSQHAYDHKHGGFNARLPGAQKGRRGK